jgi:hypothetical protein
LVAGADGAFTRDFGWVKMSGEIADGYLRKVELRSVTSDDSIHAGMALRATMETLLRVLSPGEMYRPLLDDLGLRTVTPSKTRRGNVEYSSAYAEGYVEIITARRVPE